MGTPVTRAAVADPSFDRAITPTECDLLWLAPPVSINSVRDAYGAQRVELATDYHSSCVFCPLLPPLRPGLSFEKGGLFRSRNLFVRRTTALLRAGPQARLAPFAAVRIPRARR